jgi:hypothetical protein
MIEADLLRMKSRIAHTDMIKNGIPMGHIQGIEEGCVLKKEFRMINYPGHLCKVYRRIRWEDDTKERRVYDYKIKVRQLIEPFSEDYIVLKRLPCMISQIQEFVHHKLKVFFN